MWSRPAIRFGPSSRGSFVLAAVSRPLSKPAGRVPKAEALRPSTDMQAFLWLNPLPGSNRQWGHQGWKTEIPRRRAGTKSRDEGADGKTTKFELRSEF